MTAIEDIRIQPYMYEPDSDLEQGDDEDEEDPEPRLQMNASQWCMCGNCATMPTEAENICCLEIPQVAGRMGEVPSQPTCMVDHPGFEPVCLNVYSLQNAINVYKAQYGPLRLRGIVQ